MCFFENLKQLESRWIKILLDKANVCFGLRLLANVWSAASSLVPSEDCSDARVKRRVILFPLGLRKVVPFVGPSMNVPLLRVGPFQSY